ncbi:hypothetical protein CPC08DRAFT_767825 [Agrocybe pediades]|nr:hypothetical protein CPC08DRAFT_767825 [Agrocybe pediades]
MDVEEEEEDRLDTWVSDAEAVGTKGRIGTAKAILAFALKVYPDKRSWWRRAAELEKGSWDRELLIWARTVADTERIRMKSVMFARQQGQTSTALETLSMALNKFPKFVEHYMIQGQIHQAAGNIRCCSLLFAAVRCCSLLFAAVRCCSLFIRCLHRSLPKEAYVVDPRFTFRRSGWTDVTGTIT